MGEADKPVCEITLRGFDPRAFRLLPTGGYIAIAMFAVLMSLTRFRCATVLEEGGAGLHRLAPTVKSNAILELLLWEPLGNDVLG